MDVGREIKISIKSHIFGANRDVCWCGTYHYICADCGADCTSGTSAGPPTTDSSNVTRCNECNRLWGRLRAALSPCSKAEMDAIRVALSQIEGRDCELMAEVTEENRRTATAILVRYERIGVGT